LAKLLTMRRLFTFSCLILYQTEAFAFQPRGTLPSHRSPPSVARVPSCTMSAAATTITTTRSDLSVKLRGGALPSFPALAAASILPTALGFWKTGYAVSYGYGGAVAATALLYLPHTAGIAKLHALVLAFYGIRLNLFLLLRETTLPPKMANMPAPRDATLLERLRRAPFVIGCALLYVGMAAPLRLTASANSGAGASVAVALAVAAALGGFLLAALGDAIKYVEKGARGPDYLVTGFPFNFLRHPNYTGECFGWTMSFLASVVASAASSSASLPWAVGGALGWVGILFVLAGEAAPGLEKKQREKYGGTPEYDEWCQKTWAGPVLTIPKQEPPKEKISEVEKPAEG
jgi:steroid 5-alpha reductase family enzyme